MKHGQRNIKLPYFKFTCFTIKCTEQVLELHENQNSIDRKISCFLTPAGLVSKVVNVF